RRRVKVHLLFSTTTTRPRSRRVQRACPRTVRCTSTVCVDVQSVDVMRSRDCRNPAHTLRGECWSARSPADSCVVLLLHAVFDVGSLEPVTKAGLVLPKSLAGSRSWRSGVGGLRCRESRSAGTAAWSRPGAPNVPADGARASSSRLVRAREDVGGEEALEAREVAVVRGGGELVDEPPVLAGVDGDGVALGEPRSGAPCELASVGLAEVEDLRDVTVGVPEGLAQDVDRALDGREPCEER